MPQFRESSTEACSVFDKQCQQTQVLAVDLKNAALFLVKRKKYFNKSCNFC